MESAGEGQVAAPTPSAEKGWYVVSVLGACFLLSYADRLIVNLVVDPIRAELRLTDLQISLLQGVGFALIFAMAGLPCGRLADSVNRRNLIAAGVLLWSAATIACGLAADFGGFFAARVAVGLGEAALVPAASSLIIDSFSPGRRGLALGLFSVGATLGAGAALFAGGLLLAAIDSGAFAAPLIGHLAPWRQLLILVGLPGFVMLPLLLAISEPARLHVSGLIPLAGVFRRLVDGGVWRVAVAKAILGIGDFGLVAWMPTLLQRIHGLAPDEAGGLLALAMTLGGTTSAVASGALSDRFARRWGAPARLVMLLGCHGLTVVSALVLLASGSGLQAAAAFGLWSLGSVGVYVVGHVVMQESVPDQMRATTIAISLTLSALVGIGLGATMVALASRYAFGGDQALQPAMGTVSLAASLLGFVVLGPSIRSGLAALRSTALERA